MARDMSFYDEYPSGKIVSRVTSDTEDFATVVTLTLNLLSQLLLVVLICRRAVLHQLPAGAADAAHRAADRDRRAGLPAHRARRRSQQSQRARASVNAHGAGDDQRHRRRQELPPGADDLRRVPRPSTSNPTRSTCARGCVFSGDLPAAQHHRRAWARRSSSTSAACRCSHGSVSAGTWFLFVQGIALFWFPLTSIASFWSQFQQGLAASERVFALIDAEPRVVQTDHAAGARA